jgi:hypothetical protein
MGSSQSNSAVSANLSAPPSEAEIPKDLVSDVTKAPENLHSKSRKPQLTGFAKVQHKCRRKRMVYDKCYSELYGGFISAKPTDSSACEEFFEDWRLCIMQGMKKDRDKRGLPPPLKESALAEVYENDE